MKKHLFASAFIAILPIFAQAQSIPAYIPSNGLIGWWPFSGNANDESGNGNNGTVNGATLAPDRFGNANSAYSFDGVDDFINTGFVNEISGSSQLTISYWINSPLNFPFNPAGNYGTVIGHWKNDGDFPGSPIGYQDAIFNDGTYTSSLLGAQGAFSTPNIIQQNIWQNITIVFNGLLNANERVSLYLNGNFVQFINVNNVPSQIGSTATRTYIGAACGPDGDDDAWSHFNGTIDDIGIWNRALTANEIQNLYNSNFNSSTCNPLPNNLQNGLVGYWPFCGNANDESGNGNDGTVNGAILTSSRFNEPNGAYEFDGNNDFISIPHSESLNNSSEITVSCWILLQNSSTYNNIISKDNDVFGNRSWFFGVNEDRIITATFNPNQNNFEIISPNLNFLQNWSMVSFTIGSDSLRVYVDGEKVLSAFYNSPLEQIIEPVKIGVMDETNGANWFFDGKIDDIGIWNRALSSEEVQQLYTLNACTFTIYDTVTVTEIVYDTVSVSTTDTLIIETLITSIEPAQENTFLVYPNPANTQITINNGNFGILSGYELRIANSLGQDVYNAEITQQEVTIDISTWGGNGLYILYIQEPNGNTIAVKQIVLQ